MSGTCIVCRNEKGRNKKFCSLKCESAYLKNRKTCIVCGKTFPDPPTNASVCCSKECSSKHRKDMMQGEKQQNNFKKMIAGKELFEKEHQGEKHVNAKEWVIQSPEGKIYRCRNLLYFIRSNPELFDGTERQVFDGFSKIKATRQGKRKNPSYTYKGWQLLDWT